MNGIEGCLKLMSVNEGIDESLLNSIWNKVKNKKELREMFFSVLFSIGDITNRQHNIFHNKKVDNGGNANRECFYTIMQWMWKYNQRQFIKFLNAQLFNEYSCFDLLFRNRVKTKGEKKVFSAFDDKKYRKVLSEYVYSIINGTNPFNKLLVAKFLTIPRTSARQNHKKMLPETKKIMRKKAEFLMELSKMMGWETKFFKGYRDWRKQYNGSLESVLFTTGKINEFGKQEFIEWLDKLPAQARFRVSNRIKTNNKWSKLKPWLEEWENYKEENQFEYRVLKEKVRQGQASDEEIQKLQELEKKARVTVGATSFKDLYNDIITNNVDKLKMESFIEKVNLPYNSLVIIDDSGSMKGEPFRFASFIAAVCLVKNPDDDGRNLIGTFNTNSYWYSYISSRSKSPNSILVNKVVKTKSEPFVIPELSFFENYQRISSFLQSIFHSGCTNISNIPVELNRMCKENPEIFDSLKNYPVWTIITDGEWNNLSNPRKSIDDFFKKCETYFGFRPYIVAIDISRYSLKADKFIGIKNMIYIPSNLAMIEQFLTNFKDMEEFNVLTPVWSIYRSNRYEPVRSNTL